MLSAIATPAVEEEEVAEVEAATEETPAAEENNETTEA